MRLPFILAGAVSCFAACGTPAPVLLAPNPLPPSIPLMVGPEQVIIALKYIDGLVGTGAALQPRQCVYVQYTGWLRDGTRFDSSRDTMPGGRPRTPLVIPLGRGMVIPGWDLGFEGMRVGGQRRLFIPYALAYGENGRPPVIPAQSDLIFDLELMAAADTLPRPESMSAQRRGVPCAPWESVKDQAAAPTIPAAPKQP